MNRLLSLCLVLMCHIALFAQYDDGYDPQNPPNPDEPSTYYKVTLSCEPSGAGSFNWSSGTTKVVAGTSCSINAYANTNYTFREWRVDGQVVNDGKTLRFTMPAANREIVAVYDYNPANPANPGKNFWNAETGEVIIDDFTPGNLNSAISSVIGSNNSNKVNMITVSGVVNQSDWGILNNYTNCTYLDLSRTNGMTSVPSYNFSGNQTLQTILLPASIERIETRAFYNCSNLSSITCYALTPPTIGSNAFYGVENCMAYVPAGVVFLYQEADGWKDFMILPNSSEVSDLEVNMPAGINIADYKDMFLELINIKSGQKQQYVITNRLTYTFSNLIHNTQYNVYLKNARGAELGRIDDVKIEKEDVSVTFQSLLAPRAVSLKVLTPGGDDVTAQTSITWMDEKDGYLIRGSKLEKQLEGSKVKFRIALQQSLGMEYVQPADSLYEIKATNEVTCTLQAIPKKTISGKVADMKTGLALSGATVAISQMLNGQYSKTLSTKTDNQGKWQIEVYEAKTDISVSAADYVSQSLSFDSPMMEIPTFELKDVNGTLITLNLTYTTTDGETQNFYSDYANVAYQVFNQTTGEEITEFSAQYPQIVLMTSVEEGTELKVVASSKNGKFMPVEAIAAVDNRDKANVTLAIKQLGGISASFTQTDNPNVVAILYNDKGQLVKKYEYASASLVISELQDGEYTIVSMANSQFFNSIGSISQFAEAGLKESIDYVKNVVTVRSGEMAVVENALIPFLDESKLYYTSNGTSITVNKSQITTGNYLTITGKIDFKQDYANNVSDVKLIVNLPENCAFVENSVMCGSTSGSYTYADNQIVVTPDNYGERIRFCFIPTAGGDYTATAQVQFTMNGKTVAQPIGNVNFNVQNLSICVPSTVAKTSVPISGTAPGKATVEIYDGGTLVGQTTAFANGSWNTTVELEKPYNLSTHSICAKLKTGNGLEMLTETKEVLYDMTCIEAKTVTMSFYNGWLKKNIEVVFDLQNKTISESSYMFYTTTDVTFVADLTNNDTTVVNNVTIRVYTDKNNWRNLEATYDAKSDRWIAISQFGSSELPVGVEVDIDVAAKEYIADAQQIEDVKFSFNELCSEYKNNNSEIDNAADDELNDVYKKIGVPLFATLDVDTLVYRASLANMSIKELQALVNNVLDTDLNYLDSISQIKDQFDALFVPTNQINTFLEDGSQIFYGDCSGLTPESLLERGFEKTQTTEGYYVYSLVTEYLSEYACFETNTYYKIQYSDTKRKQLQSKRAISDGIEAIFEWNDKIKNALEWLEKNYNNVTNLIGDWPKKLDEQYAQAEKDILANTKKWQECHELEKSLNRGILTGEFTADEKALAEKQIAELKIAQTRYNDKIKNIKKGVKHIPALIKGAHGLLVTFKKVLPITGYIDLASKAYSNVQTFAGLYRSIPECTEKPEIRRDIQAMTTTGAGTIVGMLVTKLGVEGAMDLATAGQVLTAPLSGGTSIISAFITTITKIAVGIVADRVYENQKSKIIGQINVAIINARKKCKNDDKKCPKCGKHPCICKPPYPRIDPIHDPSGYVYEGIASNRLQGVKASVYYKETVEDMYGDQHENIVLWEAKEYAQENPLFTDENGFYRWDVPQGLWQVKFEKEGYETTYSEWLPVPPPQLDVNIAMKQNRQPEVKAARAYEDAVEVEFDKYMMPGLLTAENISVMQNGTVVEGTVELLNEEASYEGSNDSFASKVRFNAAQPFTEQEITLMVNNRVKSYAGIRMQDNYQQTFTIEQEIKQIVSDSVVTVGYGNASTLTVSVLPASASKGKMLTVKTSSPMILGVETEQVTIGNDGKAEITVSGELPGIAALTFTVEGTDKTATTIANVEQFVIKTVATPKANIISGSTVEKGTAITLTCETEGATIYYTLDGSCPCDNTDARKVYDGTPIVINESVTIKAMAVAPDMTESDVAEFTYIVDVATGINEVTLNDEIQVYPLPVRDILNVTANGKIIKCVTVSSMNGVLVSLANKATTKVTLNVSTMPTGIYIINVLTESGSYSRKILKVD